MGEGKWKVKAFQKYYFIEVEGKYHKEKEGREGEGSGEEVAENSYLKWKCNLKTQAVEFWGHFNDLMRTVA